MDYKEVEKIIEQGLINIEIAQKESKLRSDADWKKADELVYDLHLGAIDELFNP